MKILYASLIVLLPIFAQAQLRTPVGAPDFSDWSGISEVAGNEASFQSGDTLSYVYSGQNRVYPNLKREFKGDAADWYGYAGISFEILLNEPTTSDVVVTFKADPVDHMELNPASTAKALVSGEGWQTVYLSWDLFELNIGQQGNALQGVKELEITVDSAENKKLKIRNVQITKGEKLALQSTIQGRSLKAGDTVEYELKVGNTTDQMQGVQLLVEKLGWESMLVSMEPSSLKLAPAKRRLFR